MASNARLPANKEFTNHTVRQTLVQSLRLSALNASHKNAHSQLVNTVRESQFKTELHAHHIWPGSEDHLAQFFFY